MAAQQCEIDQRQHIVDAVVMFGDAERPTDLCRFCISECMCEFADCFGWYTSYFASRFERPLFNRGGILSKAACGVFDERTIGETCVNDLAGDGIGERDIGSDVEPQPQISPLSSF